MGKEFGLKDMQTVWRGTRKSGTGRVSERDRARPMLGVWNDKE